MYIYNRSNYVVAMKYYFWLRLSNSIIYDLFRTIIKAMAFLSEKKKKRTEKKRNHSS